MSSNDSGQSEATEQKDEKRGPGRPRRTQDGENGARAEPAKPAEPAKLQITPFPAGSNNATMWVDSIRKANEHLLDPEGEHFSDAELRRAVKALRQRNRIKSAEPDPAEDEVTRFLVGNMVEAFIEKTLCWAKFDHKQRGEDGEVVEIRVGGVKLRWWRAKETVAPLKFLMAADTMYVEQFKHGPKDNSDKPLAPIKVNSYSMLRQATPEDYAKCRDYAAGQSANQGGASFKMAAAQPTM